jgi:F-type H+-transporting ATPase subunit a
MKKVYSIAIIGFILVFLAQIGITAEPPSHDTDTAHAEDTHDEGAHPHRSWLSPLSKILPDSIVPEPQRWDQPDLIPNTYFVALLVVLLFVVSTQKIKPLPEGKGQTLLEFFVGTLTDFFGDILGDDGRKYVPFVGSYFILILSLNYLGLIPGFQSPTAHLNTTLSLGITAVLGVQIIAIKENGVLGYLKHLWGEPPGIGFLMFPLEIIAQLARAASLSLRLFGNIFGEETVIFQLTKLGLGITIAGIPFLPIQVPMLFFGLFGGFLQALVFSMLTSVYIVLFVTHHHEEEHSAEAHH